MGSNKSPRRKLNKQVIDVEALLNSGARNSVTNKTIKAMTPEEKTEILDTAGKSLLLQAKKGMRVQAMKVPSLLPFRFSFVFS